MKKVSFLPNFDFKITKITRVPTNYILKKNVAIKVVNHYHIIWLKRLL